MNNGSNDTLARQWAMLRLIPRAPRKTTSRDLCRQLERLGFLTSARTVERDLHNLSGRFALVTDDSSKPYGWSWAKDADIELMPRLSPSQAVALLLSQVHLKNFMPSFLMRELASVFASAEQEVASTGWKDWHRRTAIVPTSMPLLAPKLSAEVVEHVMKGGPLPVSTLQALEAGLLALTMDDARRSGRVIDMTPIWDRYDNALIRKAA